MPPIRQTATAETTPLPLFAIPIIDIAAYLSPSPSPSPTATASLASSIRAAATSPGFFQITGHGISPALRDRLFGALKAFFALPQAAKAALHRDNSPCLRGYEAVGDQVLEEGLPDRKEGFMIGQELVGTGEDGLGGLRFGQGANQWPGEDEGWCPGGFKAVMMEYFEAVRLLSRSVFRLVALSLELEEGFFDRFVYGRDAITMCRVLRYPPSNTTGRGPTDTKPRGIGAHTDFGALTLLLQDDVGGLEVFYRPSETWHAIQPVPDAFVVNIGDMMGEFHCYLVPACPNRQQHQVPFAHKAEKERWTNDKYTSTLHRALSPVSGKDRYSVAFFNEGLLD
ncbi:hypothetical protein B0T17DRAFT_506787 [Bombardia bombarda]|uniref:Fe2OG dioxygenase domain-containing protein n=1 Tax=Bombardia bombarda TaxID=252184 RepID=A0AA40C9Q7_9PEZI|nr:hypothetical protein B0T17DRAFT_506787 [Bombardia bombarda]